MSRPADGAWVRVWAQVDEGPRTHPEDVVVRLESHSEHYTAHVRLDRVEVPDEYPDWVRRCTSLYQIGEGGLLIRCARHDRHDEVHEAGRNTWTSGSEYGNVEAS